MQVTKLSRGVAVACKSHKLPMPIFVGVSSPNGSLLVMRVGTDETSILAKRVKEGGFCEPFKVALLDQSGKALQTARV